MRTLKTAARHSLSLAHITSEAVTVGWSGDGDGLELAREHIDLILPEPTLDDIADCASALIEADPALVKARAKNGDALAPGPLKRAFIQDDAAYDEWRDRFEPMMNFAYPVSLPYQADAAAIAQLIAEFAPNLTLIDVSHYADEIGAEHALALNGAGMNFADQIAAAYLCCGCVPPSWVLSQLPGVISASKARQIGQMLRAAYKRAEEYHRARANDMKAACARVLPPKRRSKGD